MMNNNAPASVPTYFIIIVIGNRNVLFLKFYKIIIINYLLKKIINNFKFCLFLVYKI